MTTDPTTAGRRPRRITLPGCTIPPANPPLGEVPGDDLIPMTSAERADLLGYRGSHWRRHDSAVRVLTGRLAAEAAAETNPDREDRTA